MGTPARLWLLVEDITVRCRCLSFALLMDGRELRKQRLRKGLTQDQLARMVMTARWRSRIYRKGDDPLHITQSMISQIERGVRPMPRREREFEWMPDAGMVSLHDELVEILETSDDELQEMLETPASRGPYRPRAG